MPQFTYSGVSAGGQVVSGQVEASDSRDAFTRLRESGVHPTRILGEGAAAAAPSPDQAVPAAGRMSRAEVSFFTRQLADLVGAGLPLHRSLQVVWDQATRPGARALLTDVQDQVQRGSPLSLALESHPRCFPTLYCRMVAAGEASGHLGEVLERLAGFLEREQERRSQLLSALTYPLVLITVAVGAVAFLMTYLIPRLALVFADLGQELPLPTRILLAIAHFVGGYWHFLIGGIVLLVVLLLRLAATRPGRRLVDRAVLRLPLVGTIASRTSISRFARTLGTLVAGGVPILQALDIAAGASGNLLVADWALAAADYVRQGEPVHLALSQAGPFPQHLVQMVAVGEETASLPRMLTRVADAYDFEVDQRLKRLTTLLEPAIIVFMGCLVGFIVLSILLPIFQINTTIR